MVTLRDVAQRAGVSPKTVSRVVNADPAVARDTRDAVLKIIDELNYVPNEAARQMRSSQSQVIGLMTDVVATTPYAGDIVRGVQSVLSEQGLTLLIANTGNDPRVEAESWRLFRGHKVSGVIYATMFHRLLNLGTPEFDGKVVLTNCFSRRTDLLSIVPDEEAGGYRQARHLIELGHRSIGIISLNRHLHAYALRRNGMARAFAEAGLHIDPSLDLPGYSGPIEEESLTAYPVAVSMLVRKDRPTAIICGNDKVAIQVYGAASELGLSIPGDLSVMGFDDMRVITESLHPKLTSVALPHFELGSLAAMALLGSDSPMINPPSKTQLINCPLVIRASCRQVV